MTSYKILTVLLVVLANCISAFCQDKPVVDFSLVSQENIEYTALKPLFYLVRQDYIIVSRNGEKITRGGNDYFGKAFAIAVLTDDLRLWFPKSVMYPWKNDVNFKEYQRGYKPECTFTRFRSFDRSLNSSNDSLYQRRFVINNLVDTTDIVLGYVFGQKGIKVSDTIPNNGSIIIFHSSNQIPEKTEDIQYSILNVDETKWNADGICEFKVPYLGNQQIIGGAFFQRNISMARIGWELAGILVPVSNNWVIKSIVP
jgi:hypothetical protein